MNFLVLLAGFALVAFFYWRSTKEPKATTVDPREMKFSQLDSTERFDDRERLKPDDWLQTAALNLSIPPTEANGLPPKDALPDVVHAVAAKLSAIREQFTGLGDGVYCPVCHIANVDPKKLHTPCPKCSRKLLSFGWD